MTNNHPWVISFLDLKPINSLDTDLRYINFWFDGGGRLIGCRKSRAWEHRVSRLGLVAIGWSSLTARRRMRRLLNRHGLVGAWLIDGRRPALLWLDAWWRRIVLFSVELKQPKKKEEVSFVGAMYRVRMYLVSNMPCFIIKIQ